MPTRIRPLNSWDILKVIGLLLMFVDHAGAFFLPHEQWLRALGRGAAPIFLFLAGYASSYRFNRELFALAVLMTLSNVIMGEYTNPLNILFTILICRGLFAWLEKRGRRIEKPFEWYAGSFVFVLITSFLFQYGTLGLLFAIAGYLKRRPHYYSPATQKYFLILTFITYAAFSGWLFAFSLCNILIMLPVLYGDYILLWHLEIRDVNTSRFPACFAKLLKFSSDYSGYIYAFHMIAISWISHIPL